MFRILIFVLACISLSACSDESQGLNLHAEGVVASIDWKSKNHGMPLIGIKTKSSRMKWFHSTKILLNPSNLKVGDAFKKQAGSFNCEINGTKIPCIKNDT